MLLASGSANIGNIVITAAPEAKTPVLPGRFRSQFVYRPALGPSAAYVLSALPVVSPSVLPSLIPVGVVPIARPQRLTDLLVNRQALTSMAYTFFQQTVRTNLAAAGVTIDSLRNHTARHFPVQHVARATYREILERRARENAVDFVEGVGTAITPMALYETIMVKGYQTLVDPDTKVDVNTAMIAAGRLQSLLDTRSGQPDIVDIMVKQNRIIAAIRSTVPESLWPEIMRKIDGEADPAERVNNQLEASDADDEGFEPMKFADDDDDL